EVQNTAVAGRTRYVGPKILAGKILSVAGSHSRNQRREREWVRSVEAAVVDVPVVGAEGAASQRIGNPREIAAPAAIQLDLSVAQQIVGCAEARGDLVGPAEGKPVVAHLAVERGDVLRFKPHTDIQRQPLDRPLVLD